MVKEEVPRKEPKASELRFCSMAGHFRDAGKILPITLVLVCPPTTLCSRSGTAIQCKNQACGWSVGVEQG